MILSEILSLEMRILHFQLWSLPAPDIREIMVVKLELAIQRCKKMCGETSTNSIKGCLMDQIWTTGLFAKKKDCSGWILPQSTLQPSQSTNTIKLPGSKQTWAQMFNSAM